MKKTYATPTLVTSGNIVRETLSGNNPAPSEGSSTFNKSGGAGSVGFYL